ncbi:MAG: hypothetical protein CL934_15815 [Deltaproteobacteria bacterium]|nr:hypothetical protein [Deltaproteobacteria bacterium]
MRMGKKQFSVQDFCDAFMFGEFFSMILSQGVSLCSQGLFSWNTRTRRKEFSDLANSIISGA